MGDLSYLSTTTKTTLVGAINEVDGNADTATNIATAAGTTATQAKNKADDLEAYLTMNTTANATFSTSAGTISQVHKEVDVRTNASKSLGKIYGNVQITNIPTNVNTITITSADTGLRPSSPITFNSCALIRYKDRNDGSHRDFPQSYTLNTNGTITAELNATDSSQLDVFFLACLLFIVDFGDISQPE